MTKKGSEQRCHGGSAHVKLISEGTGGEGTRGLPAWPQEQLVASCITLQQMENFRAYNNVCMTIPTIDTYVFSLPVEEADHLDRGVIDDAVLREFSSNGSSLSRAARLNVQHPGRVWFIVDRDRKYSVRMVPTGLLVYSERL